MNAHAQTYGRFSIALPFAGPLAAFAAMLGLMTAAVPMMVG